MTTTYTTITDHDTDSLYYEVELYGHSVTFEGNLICDGYINLLFTVDYTLERVELPRKEKVAITRWLLECWKDALTRHNKFSCSATNDDGSAWRESMYSKLGFIKEGDAMVYN